MTTTLSFAHALAYGSPNQHGVRSSIGTRPYAWFQVFDPASGAASRREFGLIDSGCDRSFLNPGILAGMGLPSPASSIPVAVAGGGSVNADVYQDLDIEIEGIRISNVDLFFAQSSAHAGGTHLLGRRLYLGAFELAFTGNDWLHS